MGIPYLLRNLQEYNCRIPLLPCPNEKDEVNKIANRIAVKGLFNSIGIDESVFLHGHTKFEDSIDENAFHVASAIEHYINSICNFFEYYNDNNKKIYYIKIFLSVDGPPPIPKNRRDIREEKLDAYSKLSLNEKKRLQTCVSLKLQTMLLSYEKYKRYNFNVQSNHESDYFDKEEGEIELMNFAKKQDNHTTNVILTSDSDVTAMVIYNKMEDIVIVSPKCSNNCPFIWDLQSISDGLNLNYNQLIKYVNFHFVFFGSDYNYGLMNCATDSKKRIIHRESSNETSDINNVGKQFLRTKILNNYNEKKYDSVTLEYFKKLLEVEAVCSMMYYASLGEMKYLLKESPRIYLEYKNNKLNIGLILSLLNFESGDSQRGKKNGSYIAD